MLVKVDDILYAISNNFKYPSSINNVPQQTIKSVDNIDIIQEITHGSKTDKLFVSDKVKHILWTIKFIRQ